MLLCAVLAFGSMPAQQRKKATKTEQASRRSSTKKGGTAGRNSGNKPVKKSARPVSKKSGRPMTSAELKKQKQRNARELREARQQAQLNTRETEKQMNVLNDSVAALDAHLGNITRTYARQLRKSQGRRQQTSDLAFIFSSNSFAQAYRRMQSLRQFDKWRRRKDAEITEVKTRLDERRKELSVRPFAGSDPE